MLAAQGLFGVKQPTCCQVRGVEGAPDRHQAQRAAWPEGRCVLGLAIRLRRAGRPSRPAQSPGHALTLQGHPRRDTQAGSRRPLLETSCVQVQARCPAVPTRGSRVSPSCSALAASCPGCTHAPSLSTLSLNCCSVRRGKPQPCVPPARGTETLGACSEARSLRGAGCSTDNTIIETAMETGFCCP